MAPTITTAEAKRLWLQAVRNYAGLNVSEFAERMKWNRSDASAMLNGTGGRGIPDEKIDEVIAEFKVQQPMSIGLLGPTSAAPITTDQVERILTQGDLTARLLRQILEKVDPLLPESRVIPLHPPPGE